MSEKDRITRENRERLTRVWFDQSSYAKWIEASGSRVVSVWSAHTQSLESTTEVRVPRHQSPVDGDIVPSWWRSSEDSKDPGGDDATGDTGGTVDRFRLRLMGRSAHASPTDCDEGVVF